MLYDLGIGLYGAGLRLASRFDEKAAAWVEGRRGWRARLLGQSPPAGPRVWFHCASLGEFEQGRPLLEAIRARHPGVRILLTFYSPSGYRVRKDYAQADWVGYLPLDTAANARYFLRWASPSLAVFVKYELWPNHLAELARQGVPTVLVAGLFREGHWVFRPWGRRGLELLRGLDRVFVQDRASLARLKSAYVDRCSYAPDTRFDRVWQVAGSAQAPSSSSGKLSAFDTGQPIVVAGSTWPEDEAMLARHFHRHGQGRKLVVAPHELGEGRLEALMELFAGQGVARYTRAGHEELAEARVLLLDTMGQLAWAYGYARVAYVGGGFGKAVHNVLEPAAHGVPVLFGPRHEKFAEAKGLLLAEGGQTADSPEELSAKLERLLAEPGLRQTLAENARRFVEKNTGGTQAILEHLEAHLGAFDN